MKAQKLNSNFAVRVKTQRSSYMQTLPSSVGLPVSAMISDGAGGSRWQVRSTTVLAAGNLDWEANDNGAFYKAVTAAQTFTFSNVRDGMVVNLVVENTTASAITLTFPTVKAQGTLIVSVPANKANIYTFFSINGSVFATVLDGVA